MEKPILPSLPDDLAMECLVRVSLGYHTLQSMRGVCRRWRALLTDFDDSEILKERRRRNLQLPSLFLIPCLDTDSLQEFNSSACVTHKSSVIILGGHGEHSGILDFLIFDVLKRTVTIGPPMIHHRHDFVAAVLRDSVVSLGGFRITDGQGYLIENVEHHDFGDSKWVAASPLPLSTITERCSVDSDSGKMFVSGFHIDDQGSHCPVIFSYSSTADIWEVTAEESLVSHGTRNWIWCSGELILEKDFDRNSASLSFPSYAEVSEDFVRALIQPCRNDCYEDPLMLKSFKGNNDVVFSDAQKENETIRANVYPSNAVFYPSATLRRSQQSTMPCEIVGTPAMRDHMQFSKDGHTLLCMFAVLFF